MIFFLNFQNQFLIVYLFLINFHFCQFKIFLMFFVWVFSVLFGFLEVFSVVVGVFAFWFFGFSWGGWFLFGFL